VAKSQWNDAIEQAIARSGAEFFQRLIEALAERGVATTRSAVADLLQVTPASIATWASGRATREIDRIADLARANGIDLDWLLTGKGTPWHDPETDELLQRFRKLSPKGREFVLDAARMASRQARPAKKKRSAGGRARKKRT
jgi:transcriptional regulator with XRE-family HTH domain